jgi:hypothetical protein
MRDVVRGVVGGLIVAAIVGLVGWFGSGKLVALLGGVTDEKVQILEKEVKNAELKIAAVLENVKEWQGKVSSNWEIMAKDLEGFKTEAKASYETINDNVRNLETRYLVGVSDEILIQSDLEAPNLEPGKWLTMADEGRQTSMEIHFEEPYSSPPKVIVGLDSFGYTRTSKSQYIRVRPLNVLQDRFFIVLEVGAGSNVSDVHMHWLAYGR